MMRLKQVTVNKYKSFLTEQTVSIEDGVTRLVGKNESGKTAFLEALAKYNYFDKNEEKFKYDKTHDYPRNELKIYEQQSPENDCVVVSCEFEIGDELLKQIQADVGSKTFTQKKIEISHKYNGGNTYSFNSDTQAFITHFLSAQTIPPAKIKELEKAKTLKELYELLLADTELSAKATILKTNYMDKAFTEFSNAVSGYIAKTYIKPNIPQFWYFDEYYALPGQISITRFNNKSLDVNFTKEQLDIATALFSLAGIDVAKLLVADSNYETFISELEATSNSITDKFLEYWSTNSNLEIKFEIQPISNDKLLNIRIRNTKHRVTLPLKNRSKGFVWFFSFLVWFSRIENKDNIIILLDEPGLNLHADAQSDLLKYIDMELVPKYQIIYTTHSPFMIDPAKLHEVRTVYDSNDAKIGSLISEALEEKDKATLFPLQAALGYDIAQNLYISPKNLLVEGVADLVFMTLISEKLRSNGKTSLNDDITIVPVGGLDKVATFISLLSGNKLKIACLLDTFTDQKGRRRISDLIQEKIIKESHVLFFDEFTPNVNPSEIEDMFTADEYLTLFNGEFSEHAKIEIKSIDSTISITKQINRIIGKARFNHYRPANYLSRNPDLVDSLCNDTLDKFAAAFEKINKALK